MIRAELMLLGIAVETGCLGKDQSDVSAKQTQMAPAITPEQARAALLKLGSLRMITGGVDDPIFLDLKSGAVVQTEDSVVTIGRYFFCNLKEKTWRMSVSNPRIHFFAGANGRFERQSDGTWRAIRKTSYIT